MRRYLLPSIIMLVFMFSITWTARAVAQEQQTLAEKLLTILKSNHQITQEQYDELLQEAQKEKASRKAAVAKQVKAQTEESAKEFKETHPLAANAFWKDGELHLKSNDGNFTMHVGGRLQVDFGGATLNDRLQDAYTSKTGAVGFEGYGDEVRRARITLQGTAYRDFDWMAEFDFAGGSAAITDLWLTYKGMPCYANLRVGHMKEPFSLEELTSDNWVDFTERSLSNAFVTQFGHDYDTGAMLFNTEFDKHMTWAVGGYMQQTSTTGSGNSFQDFNNVNISARATYLPWYCNGGCELLHLGFGFRHLFRSNTDNTEDNSHDGSLNFENHPEWHLGPNTVNTGLIYATGANIINPEAAFVYGPFSLQGEYFEAFLDNAFNETNDKAGSGTYSNPDFDGYYVFASYFLTGEHRNYDRNGGVFGRPKLCCNFDPYAGTWGAWEVVARYSTIDLNDKSLSFANQGGKEQDWTGSLVWYLNPNVRILFDYVHAHIDSAFGSNGTIIQNGDANIFDTRFQVAW